MSDDDPDVIRPPICVNETGMPSLVALLPDGERYGWPLHLILRWKLTPRANEIEIDFGTGETLSVAGRSLGEIAMALERGRGVEIKSFPDLYEALSPEGQPFVANLRILQKCSPE